MTPDHGGPDALGVPRWDFSTHAHPRGPAPAGGAAARAPDRSTYPDPASTALRAVLADHHDVRPERIIVAASASEFIFRLTTAVRLQSAQASVFAPSPGYADYARAAEAWQLRRAVLPGDASLVWCTEPASPAGTSARIPTVREGAVLVVDEAYAPLRLEGDAPRVPATAWRLVSPNKALGLTGVRGAYAVAPDGADRLVAAMARLGPSWPLGADGAAMLGAWVRPEVQQWVADSRVTLLGWKALLLALGDRLGWVPEPSVTPFHVVRFPGHDVVATLTALRAQGLKLRDTASLGLAGGVRVRAMPPEALAALEAAWPEAVR